MGVLGWVSATLAALWLASGVAWADQDVERAEAFVRKVYFEGLPHDEARAIGPAGSARLIELLADPREIRHHANSLLAIGLAGHPDAYPALARYAAKVTPGELEREVFQELLSLPIAMGYLADRDDRALHWLDRTCARDVAMPRWTFRHYRSHRAHRLIREAAMTALSNSSRPVAAAMLDAVVEEESARGGALLEHARDARRFQARVRAKGLDAVERSSRRDLGR